ncbi:hypothetical protein [Bradyrhizobium cytisi]|uniref:Uncharacterized protein n=1 Tax=Bradyrhizobium cytisi TaxID=515489 RepID=A0A5S4WUZ8_9BRAD|nr:hypothetical protein [Bradyrhizobium cytisi]TYL85801.1 hypothetical protein FXB38_09655 [Bradyrhizobium cytisi]
MPIELNRRFVECKDDGSTDPNLVARFGRTDSTLGWADLLKRRRVVFLAEAGSGKSTEMVAQSRAVPESVGQAFYATVEDVGRLGLEGALRVSDRKRLAAWRKSDQEAWFFVDSVDEAKSDGVKLRTVVANLADAISGCERRAHIILSGRYTDWEFRRDLGLVRDALAMPPDEELPSAPTPDELVISVIHRERLDTPTPPEDVLVVVMTGLDEARVRQFAEGKGIDDVNGLLEQIESGNLWQFARRPLDLDWLTEFWRANRRLGSLGEMLRVCIAERLQESNTDRTRRDDLAAERAAAGLERVAAALVFGRKDTIAIPDGEIDLTADQSAVDLADVLPDWSPQDRARLITRAVFDPATYGRARLHNDNEGVVRGFLAARWLLRLSKANLSKRHLHDLLFADTYGVPVIKLSMQETAAWLSLWDDTVAGEVAKWNPFLLLSSGDPQSLPLATRERLLREVVKRVVSGERVPIIDFDGLRRFARADLAPEIRRLFKAHAKHDEVEQLLLRIIWAGKIEELADLAEDVTLDVSRKRYTSILAGRALMATGKHEALVSYAARVRKHAVKQPATVVWDALGTIFPSALTIDDALDILSRINVTDRDGGLGLDYIGPKLVPKIASAADLETFLRGALAQLGGSPSAGDREETKREAAYFPMVSAAATRLLELSPSTQAPEPALDAVARIGDSLRASSHRAREARPELVAELKKTPDRRRLAFWRFAEKLRGHRMLAGREITSIFDMSLVGWPLDMVEEDIDWLLADAQGRTLGSERRLAIDTAMLVWRDLGRPDALRDRIAQAVGEDADLKAAFAAWTTPAPKPPELVKSEKEYEALKKRNALERAAHDKSWTDFAAEMRNDPDKLRKAQPTTEKTADSRVYHLWRLLRDASSDRQYALDTVAPLEPMIGREATDAFRAALIAHWRPWKPWIRSARKNEELSQRRNFDSMGIAAITIEAHGNPNWARDLSESDARRAAEYGTLELTGFPKWLSELATHKPDIVCEVLERELKAELARPPDAPSFGVAQNLANGNDNITELLAPVAIDEIERNESMASRPLSLLLRIAQHAKDGERDRLKAIAAKRVRLSTDLDSSTQYAATLFALDARAATKLIIERLDKVEIDDQAALVQRVLPRVFGGQFSRDEVIVENFPLEELERLVRLAYRTIRTAEDIGHVSGEVYSPTDRDDAEHARGAVFKRIATMPGRAAFDAIVRMQSDRDITVPKAYLQELKIERAAIDSEMAPWAARDAMEFETTAETQPHTAVDLQRLALQRLEDMQHDLVNDEYQQGETLALLPKESRVQRWLADRMTLKQGRSYSVDREVHVADEREPDIRLRCKPTDATMPIEVKVAESWTLKQLEDALVMQLCGRYLRANDGRHGILLLVHQKHRPRGWSRKKGAALTFTEVVAHLKKMAVGISGAAVGGPQPEIASIDVSQFRKKAKSKATGKKSAKAAKKPKTKVVQRAVAKAKKTNAARAKKANAKKKTSTRAKVSKKAAVRSPSRPPRKRRR